MMPKCGSLQYRNSCWRSKCFVLTLSNAKNNMMEVFSSWNMIHRLSIFNNCLIIIKVIEYSEEKKSYTRHGSF